MRGDTRTLAHSRPQSHSLGREAEVQRNLLRVSMYMCACVVYVDDQNML